MAKYYGTVYGNYECCYDDNNVVVSNLDLLKRSKTTYLYSLRTSE
jgi:hypothetical protein